MSKVAVEKILKHPDKDELIGKLILGISSKDINEWLAVKYSSISDKNLIISESYLKKFKDSYLDVYTLIREDIEEAKKAVAASTEDQLSLSVKGNSSYKKMMLQLATKEIDIRSMVANLIIAIETRLAQVFDEIQEDPKNINSRVDRILIEYAETLGGLLEKYYKFTESPADLTIQHNVTLHAVDKHIEVFQNVIKEVLSQIDLESSMFFMEKLNEEMSKLKAPNMTPDVIPNTDVKLAEVKLLNETINKKLNS
jgi:hypothetical protein